MAFDEMTATAMREAARLELRVAELEAALRLNADALRTALTGGKVRTIDAARALDAAGAALAAGVLAVDPLDRAKEIRERVADLEAEVKRLVAEHETLTGGPWGKADADDIAWATGTPGVPGMDEAQGEKR